MTKPVRDQHLELSVDSLAFGGRGVARHDGFVVFVSGAFPGDRVRATVTKARRSYAEARTVEVIEASAGRIEPACRHFGVCGGCAWQALDYSEQLRFKHAQVTECLQHLGGISVPEEGALLASGPLWRYRNKVEFSFGQDPEGRLQLGFHLPGQWRRLVDIEDCLLHSETTNRIRNRIRELARESGAGAWDDRARKGFWRHLVIRESRASGGVMVNVVSAAGDFPDRTRFVEAVTAEFPEVTSLVWSINDTPANVASGFPHEVLAGADHIIEKICGLDLKVSPASFLQTNSRMAEVLYLMALDFAGLDTSETALDLFSGIGSITLLLARSCREAMGLEIVSQAVEMAVENAKMNRLENAGFRTGKVRSLLKELLAGADEGSYKPPDLVLLDPPRAGAGRKEIERIVELGPSRVVYVSCNPSTMAPNAAQLEEAGYRLARLGQVDMFPHTPHIEVVGRFDRL